MQQKRIIPRTCAYCGVEFHATRQSVKLGRAKLCSVDCRSAASRRPKPAVVIGPSSKKHAPWPERFWRKVKKTDECWIWRAYVDHAGYGRFCKSGAKSEYAHTISYEEKVGPVGDGLEIDHLCHNADPSCPNDRKCQHRRCVRPDHLEAVTHRVNALRGQGYYAKAFRKSQQESNVLR
jgi:hypothetical protein